VAVLLLGLFWFFFVYELPRPPLLDNLNCTLVEQHTCAQDLVRPPAP
jgi:hypothetical protein